MKNKLALATLVLAVVASSTGFAAAQDYRYGDRDRDDNRYSDRDDNRYYDRDGDGNRYGNGYDSFRQGSRVARGFGFRDGSQVAREDMWKNKPYNPNPRGRYDDADHGYRREFGDKHEYRERYSEAYRNAYASAFRENRYR
jgi:hypothetical protein